METQEKVTAMSKDEKFVIAFPDDRNYTMYVDGSNRGNNSASLATEFSSVEEAKNYIEEKNITPDCWIEDLEGNVI